MEGTIPSGSSLIPIDNKGILFTVLKNGFFYVNPSHTAVLSQRPYFLDLVVDSPFATSEGDRVLFLKIEDYKRLIEALSDDIQILLREEPPDYHKIKLLVECLDMSLEHLLFQEQWRVAEETRAYMFIQLHNLFHAERFHGFIEPKFQDVFAREKKYVDERMNIVKQSNQIDTIIVSEMSQKFYMDAEFTGFLQRLAL